MLSLYINTAAGSGRAQALANRIQAWLNARQIKYALWDTQDVPEAGTDILVIGGDGTFNHLLNTVPHPEDYRFILLPAGTSNSLYSQLSPDTTLEQKLTRYANCPAFRALDLPQIAIKPVVSPAEGGIKQAHPITSRFVNEASVGFAAAIAHRMENGNTKRIFNRLHLNELGYIATAFRAWSAEYPYMLSLCNNRRISGNLFPCPDAAIDDRLIDVYELDCPRWKLPYELTKLVGANTPRQSKYVQYMQTAEHTWTFPQPMPVEVDGNPLPPTRSLSLSMFPHQIQVM